MNTKVKKALILILIGTGIAFAVLSSGRSGEERGGETKILFVGDIMLDRTLRKIGESRGYDHLFSCAKDYLAGFDLVVGNLEGPVTFHDSISLETVPGEPGNTTFTFSKGAIEALSGAGVGLVSLGNNHIWDFGREGVESTKALLRESGIAHFGDPIGDISATVVKGGNRLSFVGFNQFLGENDPQKTIDAIWKARRSSDLVAVYAHWGDEYLPANEYQKALAHRFIDAGADLVVGSHPHIVQESEVYAGKPIYYSLGNFIFDQYWTEEVRVGGGLEVSLVQGDIAVKERRFDIGRDGRTCVKE
ncbi:MAG: CapA family protein [Candidatus Taylorbacteria bacterium]|nr:CapA family protein [Candidatus Taylorbacteria bacterium]